MRNEEITLETCNGGLGRAHERRARSDSPARSESRMRGHEGIFRPRNEGLSLLEVLTSLSVFAILVLSVCMTLVRGVQHRNLTFELYRAMSAVRDKVAEIQDTANGPEDLAADRGIGAVYARYHAKTFPVPELPSGQLSITCYPNENTVPTLLGGPQDLNLDGDPLDDLGNQSAGTDLKIVPMVLTLTFMESGVARKLTLHRLITKTTN